MLDDMLRALGQSGWDKFENLDGAVADQRRRVAEKAEARASDLARCFGDEAAKVLLDVLLAEYVHRPVIMPLQAKMSAEQQALFAAFRQGQMDVVASIVNAVAAVRGRDRPMQQRGETT